jgi:AcrR family transcriptional regulator
MPTRPPKRPPARAAAPSPPADRLEAAPSRSGEPDATYRRQPRQIRGQQRVDLLLDAAAEVIAEHGLNAATAEAIALRARTAKGSLYQFFPNRDAVVAALALRFADELRHIHEKAFATDPRGLALDRLIDRIVKPLASFHDRNPAFRRVFMTADAPVDSTGAAPNRIRAQLFDSIVDRLDLLFAARNPKLPARERRRAALVAASIGQSLLARRDRATAAEKKPLLDDLRRVLWCYLTPLLDSPAASPPAARTRATPSSSA